MTRFVLVHPPLLGPAVWRRVAAVMPGSAVPDLRGCVDPAEGWWERVVEMCAPLLTEDTVLVGHSGAGVVLPSIAAAGPVHEVVFVDAIVPSRHGVTEPSAGIREFVAALPRDGDHLPRWTEWWSAEDVASLVEDPLLLQQIVENQGILPVDFYDQTVPVPDGWDDNVRCRYVQFSAAYTEAATAAGARGWDVTHLPGTHLHQVDHPDDVAAVLAQRS